MITYKVILVPKERRPRSVFIVNQCGILNAIILTSYVVNQLDVMWAAAVNTDRGQGDFQTLWMPGRKVGGRLWSMSPQRWMKS